MPSTMPTASQLSSWMSLLACGILGIALGLYLGRLLAYPFRYGTPPATQFQLLRSGVAWAIVTVAGLLASRFGGGGEAMWSYILGLALGLLTNWWHPNLPPVFSESEVRRIIALNNKLDKEVHDPEKRTTLAMLPFQSPEALRKARGKTPQQIAREVEEAIDALTDDQLARIRQCLAQLTARWNQLPLGGSLELAFEVE